MSGPPYVVDVDGYEFEVKENLEIVYLGKASGIVPEISKANIKSENEENAILEVEANTKDEQGLRQLIVLLGDIEVQTIELNGKEIKQEIIVNRNGKYRIKIVGNNHKQVISSEIEVTAIAAMSATIKAGTVINGRTILTIEGSNSEENISKVETYVAGRKVKEDITEEAQIKKEVETEYLDFYEDVTCYSVLTDKKGNTVKTNEVVVKNSNAIMNEKDLKKLAEVVESGTNFEGKTIQQIETIDLQQNHIVIGKEEAPFKGNYNGNQKKIIGIKIDNTENNQGLFGYIEGSRIEGVILGGGTIKANVRAGGVVGYCLNSEIERCENLGTTVQTTGYEVMESETGNYEIGSAGGIVGRCEQSNIQNAKNETNINAIYGSAGGIVGYHVGTNRSEIINCSNSGSISGGVYALGGIAGVSNYNGYIKDCTNTGNIIATTTKNIGGILGSSFATILQGCKNSGTIEGSFATGGIVGLGDATIGISTYIMNCDNSGEVKAVSYQDYPYTWGGQQYYGQCSGSGGIAGVVNLTWIEKCNNQAKISAKYNAAGGIAGIINEKSTIIKCANKGVILSEEKSAGGMVGFSNSEGNKSSTIEQSYNTGVITADYNAGGMVGWSSYTTVKNCYNVANISAINDYAGGIIGAIGAYQYNMGYEMVSNSYNIGNISGRYSIGAIMGRAQYDTTDYVYALQGSATSNQIFGEANGQSTTGKYGFYTQSDMKQTSFLNLLNTSNNGIWTFKSGMNNGYPVLSWQE